ncbi:UDP-N-acetylmuramoyl-tripeptide--D-alanyl-D-alanine ligase [Schaalia sp. lx-100]|uniref:UDP-N-acetylmuramoyl-tripeptide--D-alanyl-D- alanine ligase n=1 Tax=Schaalia sp. lx-100 TaxID=2899081 RepID=UPI001E579521|nr:UDP-N-acetylmuramoyl-tripeptide--D-alanyl-D-alanine ligase [Schaalia sp. lx-100]MCD4557048.1 UDP-N-acetylmuramoyl-tripeptide--D-alanyl-D-alanine ligase [Schaalia sp. lx-100]
MHRSSDWIAQALSGQITGPSCEITGIVTTDSREVTPGSLYVARRGENADGHDYLASAKHNGAVAAIVEEYRADGPNTQIRVPDATRALGRLAQAHLADLRVKNPNLRVLAVTGSAGKTTTKDLLHQILSVHGPTVAPKLSFNNEVGMPLTVLTATENTRYLVLEMGASGRGHIAYLAHIAPPDVAVELMVGHAHMGGFGNVEGIAQAKAELVEALTSQGIAVLNADDPNVMAMSHRTQGHVMTFSAAGKTDACVIAADVEIDEKGCPSFSLMLPTQAHSPVASVKERETSAHLSTPSDEITEYHTYPVTLQLVGIHHVANALAAATAAYALGLEAADIAKRLSNARAQSPHRMDVRSLNYGSCRYTLIDDSYNANVDSISAAITALGTLAGTRPRIALLGEMLELGDEAEAMHRQVGQMARHCGINTVITLGDGARYITQELSEATRTRHARTPQEAFGILSEEIVEDCVLLVKGSHGSGAHLVADMLIERGTVR